MHAAFWIPRHLRTHGVNGYCYEDDYHHHYYFDYSYYYNFLLNVNTTWCLFDFIIIGINHELMGLNQ